MVTDPFVGDDDESIVAAAVPSLRLLTLGALRGDGTFVTVGAYQHDSAWGLWQRRAASDHSADWAGIYRMR
jgi:hypothetical protein